MRIFFKILHLTILTCSILFARTYGQQLGAVVAYPFEDNGDKYKLPIKMLDYDYLESSQYIRDLVKFHIKRISEQEIDTSYDFNKFMKTDTTSDTINTVKDFDIDGNVIRTFRSPAMTEELYFFYDKKKRLVLTCYNKTKEKCDTSHYYIYNNQDLLIEQGEYRYFCCGDVSPKTYYKYSYNQSGQLLQTDQYNYRTKENSFKRSWSEICFYDNFGRRTKIEKHFENFSIASELSVFRYDSLNRIVYDSNKNEIYFYKYGINGLLIEKTFLTKALYTPKIVQTFIFDDKGNFIKGISSSDSITITTTYEYNNANKIVKYTSNDNEGRDKSSSECENFYNENGLLIRTNKTDIGSGWTNYKSIRKSIIEYEFY